MRRDWELIRAILAALEAQPDMGGRVGARNLPDWPAEVVHYHLWLLIEAGLVAGRCQGQPASADGMTCHATLLTWSGQEFLAATRSDASWERIRRALVDRGIDLSFEAIRAAAGALFN